MGESLRWYLYWNLLFWFVIDTWVKISVDIYTEICISELLLIRVWKSQLVFIFRSGFLICHWYMGESLSWYLYWNLHFWFVIDTWVKVSVGIYTEIWISEAWNIEKFCLSSLILKPWRRNRKLLSWSKVLSCLAGLRDGYSLQWVDQWVHPSQDHLHPHQWGVSQSCFFFLSHHVYESDWEAQLLCCLAWRPPTPSHS